MAVCQKVDPKTTDQWLNVLEFFKQSQDYSVSAILRHLMPDAAEAAQSLKVEASKLRNMIDAEYKEGLRHQQGEKLGEMTKRQAHKVITKLEALVAILYNPQETATPDNAQASTQTPAKVLVMSPDQGFSRRSFN